MDLDKKHLIMCNLLEENEEELVNKKTIIYKTKTENKEINLDCYFKDIIKELEKKGFYNKNPKVYEIMLRFEDKVKNTKENKHKIIDNIIETLEKELELDKQKDYKNNQKKIYEKLKNSIRFSSNGDMVIGVMITLTNVLNASLDSIFILSKQYIKNDLSKKIQENLKDKLNIKTNLIIKEINDLSKSIEVKQTRLQKLDNVLEQNEEELIEKEVYKRVKKNTADTNLINQLKEKVKLEVLEVKRELEKEQRKLQNEIEKLEAQQMQLEEELYEMIQKDKQPKPKEELEIKEPTLKPKSKPQPVQNMSLSM